MGSDEVQEIPLHHRSIKAHLSMCTQLLTLVDRISSIFQDIEAARPRCKSGMQALCTLWKEMNRARELVQKCCECSKLYSAITGDMVVTRFEKTVNILEQSLSELQTMVPVVLQLKISEIRDDLRSAIFFMDSHEEVAGKALRALLQQEAPPVNSVGNSEIELLQFAASMLHLTSHKDLLTEERSLRKLLDEVKQGSIKKRKTVNYLHHLLKKHEKLIVQGQSRNPSRQPDESCLSLNSDGKSVTTKSTDLNCGPGYAQAWASILYRPTPPEKFKCPLSSRLMYDPVIISSGQTFERTCIQKWFDDGHDTCPRTRMKLTDLSVIPNTSMRDLISKWSMENGISVSDPSIPTSKFGSLKTSSNSFNSDASSVRDLNLRIDISNLSLGSLDSSCSNISHAKLEYGFGSVREQSDVDSHSFQFYDNIDDIRSQFLSNIGGLSWVSQCRAVRDVKTYLVSCNPSCSLPSPENFLDPLVQFLRDALDKHDGEAQKDGLSLFLVFAGASRRRSAHISEDVHALLASFLATEAAAETLAIMEVLSSQVSAVSKFAASGALTSIMKILDTHNREFQEVAIKILYNLSLSICTTSCKLASDWIPKLVPFLGESSVAGTCLGILENLCKYEATRVSIASKGCIASIIELLENGGSEEQERAVGILLSLCSQRDYYCQLVLDEGGVPALVRVSVGGNDKGKVIASELLRLLKDIKYEDGQESVSKSNDGASEGCLENIEEEKSSKRSGSILRKIKMFFRKK